jgi:hypothetical protein
MITHAFDTLLPIGKKVGAAHLAFDEDRTTAEPEADGVGDLA